MTKTANATSELVPCVVVSEGRSRGRVFVLQQARSYVVGRLPGAEIFIDDPGVSRRHVKLTRKPDGSVEAADMRSTNGLIINDERVDRGPLLEGDTISLGPDAVLRLEYRALAGLAELVRAGAEAHASRRPAAPSIHDLTHTQELTGDHPPELSEDHTAIIIHRARLEDLPISARQLEVSQHVADGLTNAAIAERLGISPRTVTSHLDHIYGRLGISSRAALTRWVVERGLASSIEDTKGG